MLNEMTSRQRYSAFFVLFLTGSLTVIMLWSAVFGMIRFEDNLVIKNFLIEKTNFLRLNLGDRVFPQVLIGKDGWMDFTGDYNLDDYQNVVSFNDEQVLMNRIAALDQFTKEQGITLLIVVAPNKATVYPDKLPDGITKVSEESRLDHFITLLKENNLPPILDLRPILINARSEREVYYKTNTHWNGYGAFVAYTAILNELEKTNPEVKAYKEEELEIGTKPPSVQDIPKLLQANYIKEAHRFYLPKGFSVYSLTLPEYFGFNHITSIPDSNLPTLLMYHDSFGYRFLNEYISMNFGKAYFIHSGDNINQYLNRESIQQFGPDIIVIEIVERGLDRFEAYLSNFDTP